MLPLAIRCRHLNFKRDDSCFRPLPRALSGKPLTSNRLLVLVLSTTLRAGGIPQR